MDCIQDGPGHVLKLEPGERVIESLVGFAREHRIGGASLAAIGAVNHARLGFYQPSRRDYDIREFEENLELVSLLGSLAGGPEGPLVHAHVALGRSDFSLVGGHLFEATCSVTVELFVSPTAVPLHRALDPRFRLNLLCAPEDGPAAE